MKVSKTLTSAVAAAAVVGAIGLVYAQTPDTAAPAVPADTSSPPMQSQGTTTSPGSMQTPAASDAAALPAERPAQADRN